LTWIGFMYSSLDITLEFEKSSVVVLVVPHSNQ
jgi:hypothetical protein